MIRCPHCRKKLDEDELIKSLDETKLLRYAGQVGGRRAWERKRANPDQPGPGFQSSRQARRAVKKRWAEEPEVSGHTKSIENAKPTQRSPKSG